MDCDIGGDGPEGAIGRVEGWATEGMCEMEPRALLAAAAATPALPVDLRADEDSVPEARFLRCIHVSYYT